MRHAETALIRPTMISKEREIIIIIRKKTLRFYYFHYVTMEYQKVTFAISVKMCQFARRLSVP